MKNLFLRLFLFLLLSIGIFLTVIYRDSLNIVTIQHWIEQSGTLAPLIFMIFYVLATIFFLPGSVLTLAGGALFGPVWGVIYNLTAATIGATISFLAARYLASNWVAKKSGGQLKRIINGVENEGWRFVAFVRLVPIFPFNLLNYALGLTKIKLLDYFIATYLCMLPGATAYTYLGYIGREAVSGGEGIIQKTLLAIALLALVLFLPRMIKNFRQQWISIPELKQLLETNQDILLLDVRSKEDFYGEQGHIHGARHIPLEKLEQELGELSKDLDKQIITICRTDRRSKKAASLLVDNKFSNVSIAKMGMTDWTKYGYLTN